MLLVVGVLGTNLSDAGLLFSGSAVPLVTVGTE